MFNKYLCCKCTATHYVPGMWKRYFMLVRMLGRSMLAFRTSLILRTAYKPDPSPSFGPIDVKGTRRRWRRGRSVRRRGALPSEGKGGIDRKRTRSSTGYNQQQQSYSVSDWKRNTWRHMPVVVSDESTFTVCVRACVVYVCVWPNVLCCWHLVIDHPLTILSGTHRFNITHHYSPASSW